MASLIDILKEKLRSHKPAPTAHSWAKMEALIDAEPALNPQPTPPLSIKRWSAAAVLLLSLGIATWYFYPGSTSVNKEVTATQNNKPSPTQLNTIANAPDQYGPFLTENSKLKTYFRQKPFGKKQTAPGLAENNEVTGKIPANTKQQPTGLKGISKSSGYGKIAAEDGESSSIYRKVKPANKTVASTPNEDVNTAINAQKLLESRTFKRQPTLQVPSKTISYNDALPALTTLENYAPLKNYPMENFRINGRKWNPRINLISGVYQGDGENSFGIGAELELQNNGWRASAGVINHSVNVSRNVKVNKPRHEFHSEEHLFINAQIEQHIDSTWVILGFNKGTYQLDTSYHTTYDTIRKTATDTNTYDNWLNRPTTTTMSYTEIPVHVSYAWLWQRWEISAGAGFTTGFLTQKVGGEHEDDHIENHTIGDASLRLGLRYHISPKWSIILRPNYRFNIWQSQPIRATQSRTGLQWGVSLAL